MAPFNLLLSPAERADVVIDFNGVPAGSTFILYADAPAPFPGGDPRNDYFTGGPDQTAFGGAPPTLPGFGPNTRTLMKIVVTTGAGDSVSTSTWLNNLNAELMDNFLTGNQPGLLYNNGNPSVPGPVPYNGSVSRMLTLNEDFDEYGRLVQTIGTFTSQSLDNAGLPTWGLPYISDATETPSAGSTEVWQIFNLTGDTHPIHFHLVNVQVIQRQPFSGVPGNFNFTGSPIPPDANEIGWKALRALKGCPAARRGLPRQSAPSHQGEVRGRRDRGTGAGAPWRCVALPNDIGQSLREISIIEY